MKWIISLMVFFMIAGCKGTDGDDGKINVTLTSSAAFKAETSALGCFVVTSSSTQCLCYESGIIQTGTAASSSFCKNVASSVTLVAEATKISDATAGDHKYCSSNNPSNWGTLCAAGDANTSTATLEKQSGESGGTTTVVLPKNGDDGGDNNYTVVYTDTGRSISK